MKILVCGLPFSGKTEVMKILKYMGKYVFISDDFIKSIYKPKKEGYILIKNFFGLKFINKWGVDKVKLRSYIYENKHFMNQLNKLIQPLIVKEIKNYSKNKELLFVESKVAIDYNVYYNNLFDLAWLVIAKKHIRDKRFILNYSNNKFIKKEMNDDFYFKKAINLYKCIIIENNSSKKELEKSVSNSLNKLKALNKFKN